MRKRTWYPAGYQSVMDFGYNNLPEVMAQQLRQARFMAKLTQVQLAKRAGTSQPSVARAEKGGRPMSISYFLKLLDACDCDLQFHLTVVRETK